MRWIAAGGFCRGDYEGWERASPWCDEAQRRALVAGFAEEDATLCRRYAVEGFPDWEPSAAPSGWAPPPELIDDVVAAWRAWLAEDPAARHLP